MNRPQKATLTFVGNHPDDDTPICGLITSYFDSEDVPLSAHTEDNQVTITSRTQTITFTIPTLLADAIKSGTAFYVANIGGSEESFKVPVTSQC